MRDDPPSDARRGSAIPAGALTMLLAISGVFAYGIYLKAAGPPLIEPPAPKQSAPASPGAVRPSARPASPAAASPDEGVPTQSARGYGDQPAPSASGEDTTLLPPVIPEATTAGTLSGGLTSALGSSASAPRPEAPGASASPSAASPSPAPNAISRPASTTTSSKSSLAASSRAGGAAAPGSTSSRPAQRSSEPSPSVKVRHEEPPASPHDAPVPPPGSLEAARGGSGASAPSAGDAPETANRLAIAPRGAAPAVALKRAHEQFTARKYKDAARSWNDWAQRAPSGSWTVQIAAIRLDQAGTGRLDGLGGRDGVFVLPSGALAGGLSPVCVGVYPSEEAARRAAASMAPYPGSSSKPIAKPLSSVANSGHVP